MDHELLTSLVFVVEVLCIFTSRGVVRSTQNGVVFNVTKSFDLVLIGTSPDAKNKVSYNSSDASFRRK
jgi:hypothetical protein